MKPRTAASSATEALDNVDSITREFTQDFNQSDNNDEDENLRRKRDICAFCDLCFGAVLLIICIIVHLVYFWDYISH